MVFSYRHSYRHSYRQLCQHWQADGGNKRLKREPRNRREEYYPQIGMIFTDLGVRNDEGKINNYYPSCPFRHAGLPKGRDVFHVVLIRCEISSCDRNVLKRLIKYPFPQDVRRAGEARKCQGLERSFTPLFTRNDVVVLEWQWIELLGPLAVFAAATGTVPDFLAERGGHGAGLSREFLREVRAFDCKIVSIWPTRS